MTSGLLLYARSRRVPAAAGALLASAALLGAGAAADGAADPRLSVLAAAVAVAAAAPGLGGQDAALDRTAAIRWAPLRAAHVLLIAAAVTLVLLAAQTAGREPVTAAFLLRDAAGLTGLAALGAVLLGAEYAWTPVVGWPAVTLFAPPDPAGVGGWLLAPPDARTAAWTAGALLAAGATGYAAAGPRR
ncbi:hypothetical protein [Streptomyces anulatus]|uniref:hypothetical protein n=1 Tax=Streptomyces anulatus TaxID=1892 RepID=UPI0034006A8C|nr:hypothetical protein OG238_03940 [Streptomyces anulatus]WSU27443.1 hypothetical protein OG391_03080 [Streptomyces anulatus]WSU93661.1 hypothetical protein OG575_35635 [Streptomyces anulatus]